MRLLDIRPGVYRDSVRLMQISSALAGLPGVSGSLVAMATELNLDLLPGLGFERPTKAGPNDLLVALVASSEETLAAAQDRLETELGAHGSPESSDVDGVVAPRTTGSAVAATGASVVLVSTPGRYAAVEAWDALDAGASVMIFSDNVPVAQEVALKRAAAERGLLVMGPDCGTAVIGGVGLGFANVVRPGPVGLVAASGTGAQQVMSLLAWAGVGISHCLGVGGRDLSAAVGGVSTLAALDLLDADPQTSLIVLIGKPPAPSVAEAVAAHAARLSTPVVLAPLGAGQPDLTAAVADVLTRMGVQTPAWPSWTTPQSSREGQLVGLYSGGTLCVEAMAVASGILGPIRSNVPLSPDWTLDSDVAGHYMIDLGDDEFTVGRPHPMLDPAPRLERLAAVAADPSCGAVLLDVVLGHGAHPDPGADLAGAIAAAKPLPVVVSLVGTVDDPQGLRHQAEALSAAGAAVFLSNADAARYAAGLL